MMRAQYLLRLWSKCAEPAHGGACQIARHASLKLRFVAVLRGRVPILLRVRAQHCDW